ncbi:hypothetical protein DPMN_075775, partial [Dreissena polymorpha]
MNVNRAFAYRCHKLWKQQYDVKCIYDVLSEFLPLSKFIRIDPSGKTIGTVEDKTILV